MAVVSTNSQTSASCSTAASTRNSGMPTSTAATSLPCDSTRGLPLADCEKPQEGEAPASSGESITMPSRRSPSPLHREVPQNSGGNLGEGSRLGEKMGETDVPIVPPTGRSLRIPGRPGPVGLQRSMIPRSLHMHRPRPPRSLLARGAAKLALPRGLLRRPVEALKEIPVGGDVEVVGDPPGGVAHEPRHIPRCGGRAGPGPRSRTRAAAGASSTLLASSAVRS